jgi:hypothetical protein
VLQSIPSREKISRLLFSIFSNSLVNVIKDISFPIISLPKAQKNELALDAIFMKAEHNSKEKFIKIAIKIVLIKNLYGASTCEPTK